MRMYPALLLVVGLSLSSCDDPGGPDPGGPSPGTLVVSTSTEGDDPDGDGYLLTVDGVDSMVLAATGTAEIGLPAGQHTLQLLGVAGQCSVAPATSLEVEVPPQSTTSVAFEISCPLTGVRITTATTGVLEVVVLGSGAAAPFEVMMDGATLASVGPRGARVRVLRGCAPR